MRDRILDLLFLLGIFVKGLDGVIELIGGAILFFVTPAQIGSAAEAVTAHELGEDPHDLLANLLLHGTAQLDTAATSFLAAYLVVHGAVKVALIAALVVGSLRVYPWAILVLIGFLGFQLYEMVVHPSVLVAVLTVIDALLVWLTWREWRRGRTLRATLRDTRAWIGRRGRGE